ncbi:MAG: glycosyltransferase family 39 protein [Candidatus Sumerlaeia bacterium]|nr:glycosyltransferase family 39 protein [Candidatus Sumerlaeia bacterium]
MSRTAVILFLVFLLLYLLTMGGHIYSPDEEILFQMTRAIAERGSLAVERPKEMPPFAVRVGVDGREYGQYGIGQPLLAVPFYWLGRLLAEKSGDRAIGFSVIQYHGRTPREEWQRLGVSLFNQLIAALVVVVLFSLAADLTGDRTAAAMTAILYGAGTIAWVHSKPFFTETLATLCTLLSFALIVRARLFGRPGLLALAGCAAGYALLTRLDSIAAFPALGLMLLWPHAAGSAFSTEPTADAAVPPRLGALRRFLNDMKMDTGRNERIGRFAPPVALACLVIAGLNWMRYGSPLATGYEAQPEGIQFINPLLVGLYGFLFSVGKGIFFFSPPLVLFFWAIRRFITQAPQAAWGAIVLIVSLLLFHSKWINWAGGWCWGPRHIFMVHVFLALPVCALLMKRTAGVRIAYGVLLVCGIAVQLLGTSQNFIDYHFIAFRYPFAEPKATLRYDPFHDGQFLHQYYEVKMKANPLRGESVIEPWQLPAPVSDSIWRIEASPWVMYRRMIAAGYHDFFWLERLGVRSRAHEVFRLMQTLEAAAEEPLQKKNSGNTSGAF